MNTLQVPEFKTYEEEAAFWDNLDTAPFMEDDGEWFRFETSNKRAIRVAMLLKSLYSAHVLKAYQLKRW